MCYYVLQQFNIVLVYCDQGGVFFIEVVSVLGLCECYGYVVFEWLMVQVGQCLVEVGYLYLLVCLNDNSFLLLVCSVDEDVFDSIVVSLCEQLLVCVFVICDDEFVYLCGVVGYVLLLLGFDDVNSVLEVVECIILQVCLFSVGVVGYVYCQVVIEQEYLVLLEGQLELVYQLIVVVVGGNIVQYQLLLCFCQVDGIVLVVGQVILVVEVVGCIVDFDQQVMDYVLGLLDLYCYVMQLLNLFVLQLLCILQCDVFVDWLLELLQQCDLLGSVLVIDVCLLDVLIYIVLLQQFCQCMVSVGVCFCLSQFEFSGEVDVLLNQLLLLFVCMVVCFFSSYVNLVMCEELCKVIDQVYVVGLQIIGQQIEDLQVVVVMWVGGVDYIQGNMVQLVGSDLNFDFYNVVF